MEVGERYNSSPLWLRVEIEGLLHKITIKDPSSETLLSVCNKAIVRHLEDVFEIDKEEAAAMVESGTVKVGRVEEDGSLLDRRETISETRLSSGTTLRAIIKGEALSRIRSCPMEPPQPPTPPQNQLNIETLFSLVNSTADNIPSPRQAGSFVFVKINQQTFKVVIRQLSTETLRRICNDAVVRFITQERNLTIHEAVAVMEKRNVRVVRVTEAGANLYIDETMAGNGLSSGAHLEATFEGLSEDDRPERPPDFVAMENRFSSEEILKATDNFSERNLLGKGGQGEVYRGHLLESLVAVKRYTSADLKDMEKEIRVLQKVRHPNIILLMGCCPEERCIVSEFMAGGSLHSRLRGGMGSHRMIPLTWTDRRRIAKEIVSAIYFLHGHRILHRDLKPGNVLFDSHGTVKVADMCLARLSEASVTISGHPGTFGYLDPSFVISRISSPSSDIYALGLIILQLCTHQADIQEVHAALNMIEGIRKGSSHGLRVFEPLLAQPDSSLPAGKVQELLAMGLQCVERDPIDRPTLLSVLRSLSDEVAMEGPGNSGRTEEGESITGSTTDNMDPSSSNNTQGSSQGVPVGIEAPLVEAMKGSAESQFYLGQCYDKGEIVKKSRERAVEWYDRAAKQGHLEALVALNALFGPLYDSIAKSWLVSRKQMRFLQESARQGVAPAQFYLGHCHFHGHGVAMDLHIALEWYLKAAHQGEGQAQRMAGECYRGGHGVKQDKLKALEWYTMAAENGNVEAMHALGECCSHGWGMSRNEQKAAEWYRKAAEMGHIDAQFQVGECYRHGLGVEREENLAVEWLDRAARQGHKGAAAGMAALFESVFESMKESVRSGKIKFLEVHAARGLAPAQFYLGECFFFGIGAPKNKSKAVALYTEAAKQGHVMARYNLGICHQQGHGVHKDRFKAKQCFDKAIKGFESLAREGNPEAQYRMSMCFKLGHGVLEDKVKSVEWSRKAALQGHRDAQYWLGMCHYSGWGMEVDHSQAVDWWTMAAERGDREAQTWLGECFMKGFGVEEDKMKALEWYTKAADQGDSLAKQRLLDLSV